MSDFFTFYLGQHRNATNRALHLAGTSVAFCLLVASAFLWQPWFLLAALLSGYAFAWAGHAMFEKNKPATFKAPLKSFASDWRMWALWLTGRLGKAMEERGVSNAS